MKASYPTIDIDRFMAWVREDGLVYLLFPVMRRDRQMVVDQCVFALEG